MLTVILYLGVINLKKLRVVFRVVVFKRLLVIYRVRVDRGVVGKTLRVNINGVNVRFGTSSNNAYETLGKFVLGLSYKRAVSINLPSQEALQRQLEHICRLQHLFNTNDEPNHTIHFIGVDNKPFFESRGVSIKSGD